MDDPYIAAARAMIAEADSEFNKELERAQARIALAELQRRYPDGSEGSELDPLSFLGKLVVFNHQPDAEPVRVLRVRIDGMLEIDSLPGWFAPHLFKKAGEFR